jgi:hypothetical protein
MREPKDIIDQTLETALRKPGLIDWNWILADLLEKKVGVEKRILYRRVKALLKSRAQEPWLW